MQPIAQPGWDVHGVLPEAPVRVAVRRLATESLQPQIAPPHASSVAGHRGELAPFPRSLVWPRARPGAASGSRGMPSTDVWVSFVVTSVQLYPAAGAAWQVTCLLCQDWCLRSFLPPQLEGRQYSR